ncbi:MAG: hypothetical protein IKB57_02110 [Bacteroidaceae bacterium]|nr:hypothetical protein [Bacteroidaceae bacterium]
MQKGEICLRPKIEPPLHLPRHSRLFGGFICRYAERGAMDGAIIRRSSLSLATTKGLFLFG